MQNIQEASVYTDFNRLATLKNEAKAQTPKAIKEVAKQFESIFVGMMLKSMRQASLAKGIFDSSQSDFYRDMYDQQLSLHLGEKGGIGLADLIEKQLSPHQYETIDREQKVGDHACQMLQKSSVLAVKSNEPVTKIKQSDFKSSKDFIQKLQGYAKLSATKLGVSTHVLLSQAALETGWGKSVIQLNDKTSHNLFNIKAGESWLGDKVSIKTLEYKEGRAYQKIAEFRVYSSYQDSFDDYVDLIKNSTRYQTAIKQATNPKLYLQALQKAGYATDPNYADKVMRIYQGQVSAHSNPKLQTKTDV